MNNGEDGTILKVLNGLVLVALPIIFVVTDIQVNAGKNLGAIFLGFVVLSAVFVFINRIGLGRLLNGPARLEADLIEAGLKKLRDRFSNSNTSATQVRSRSKDKAPSRSGHKSVTVTKNRKK